MKEESILDQAKTLLQNGKSGDARQLLVAHLRRNPNSAEAWWLLSKAIGGKKKEKDCLDRVLRLDPAHAGARARLSALRKPAPAFLDQDALESEMAGSSHLSRENHSAREQAQITSEPHRDASPPPRRKKSPPKKQQKISGGIIAIVAIVFCLGIVGIGYFGVMIVNATNVESVPAAPQILLPTNTPRPPQSLPPTWTPTPSFTPLPTRTPLPSAVPTQTIPPMATFTKPPRITGASVGNYAPNFTLKNVSNGNNVSLSSYSGRPVMIVFWAVWCTYCEKELPALNNIYKKYKDQGFVILSINVGDKESKVKKYRSSHSMSYPVLLDPKKSTTSSYRVSGIPVHYFINADGKIVSVSSGMINESTLERIVQSLIADK